MSLNSITVKQTIGVVFYIITNIICGGILGFIIGLFLSKSSGHAHIPDLTGLVIGAPIGMLLGLIGALLTFRTLTIKQRIRSGFIVCLCSICTLIVLAILFQIGVLSL